MSKEESKQLARNLGDAKMKRRLVTDAMIVLNRAGYTVECTEKQLHADTNRLAVTNWTVNDDDVQILLRMRGCDAWGYPRRYAK